MIGPSQALRDELSEGYALALSHKDDINVDPKKSNLSWPTQLCDPAPVLAPAPGWFEARRLSTLAAAFVVDDIDDAQQKFARACHFVESCDLKYAAARNQNTRYIVSQRLVARAGTASRAKKWASSVVARSYRYRSSSRTTSSGPRKVRSAPARSRTAASSSSCTTTSRPSPSKTSRRCAVATAAPTRARACR